MSESAADIEEVVKALDALGELSIEDILNPAGEDETHFTYTDDVVIEMVISCPENFNIETTYQIEDSPAELLDNLPTDPEFAAVVLRRLMAESDTSSALSVTNSVLNKRVFGLNTREAATAHTHFTSLILAVF
ncbi:hypothetical protein PHYPSEUDO_003183 [Phytophthora pseudosyringae]|uniref:Uncharacterized protein n=1 Tax=Phytophthora pseudosyringae TaxID=221518 RepID=A0A8T1VRZ9_9STRA|nr:hypothetical protein PHYPSEUDO_003183 [Phytophthora pseudosyringae]